MADEQTYTGQTGTGYGRTLGGEAGDEAGEDRGDGLLGKVQEKLAGGGEEVAAEPKTYSRTDERIRDDVHERLKDDPFLDASGIQVIVTDGEVTLAGAVSGSADKRRAQDLTENVSGVSQVKNELRVESAATL